MASVTTLAQLWAGIAPPTWTRDDLVTWLADRAPAQHVLSRGAQLGLWHRDGDIYRLGPDPDARPRRVATWIAEARAAAAAEESRLLDLWRSGVQTRAALAEALGVTEARVARRLLHLRTAGHLPPVPIGRPTKPPAPPLSKSATPPAPKEPKMLAHKPAKPHALTARATQRRAAEDAEVAGLWRRGVCDSVALVAATGMSARRVADALARLRKAGAIPPGPVGRPRTTPVPPPPPPRTYATPELRLLAAIDAEPWSTAEELGADPDILARWAKVGLVELRPGWSVALTDDGRRMLEAA